MDLSKAIELITREVSGLEKRQKELRMNIRNLEGEFQIAQSEYKQKMAKLRLESEIEQKAILAANEPTREISQKLKDELAALRKNVEQARHEALEIKTAKNLHAKEVMDTLDSAIARKQKQLDGINYAINEARRAIGVH